MLATLSAQVLGIFTRWLAVRFGASERLGILSGTLLLVALLAGTATLGLTVLTLRLRAVPPPRPIVVAAVVSGIIPWLTLCLIVSR